MGRQIDKVETYLTSYSTVEVYRLILGLELHGGIPFMEELPDSFLIPAAILRDVASARQQTSKDRTNRAQRIFWDGERYNYDRIYLDNLRDALPSTLIFFSLNYLPHKALLLWRTDRRKTSFNNLDITLALSLPGLAFIHAIATPDDIHLMVQTKKSAQIPIIHWAPVIQGMIGYPIKASRNYDLGGIAQFLQKRGFGMYQLTPSADKFNPPDDSGYKFQRIIP